MFDIQDSYRAIRRTAGVYQRGNAVLTVTGPQRRDYVQFLLARSVEFAGVNSCVDSLLLDEQANPVGAAVAVVAAEFIDVVVDAPQSWLDHAISLKSDYDVEVDTTGKLAVQVEGPQAWKVAGPFVPDRHISDVLLNEALDTEVNGELARLGRTGTTAEYGYLFISSSASLLSHLAAQAETVGGGQIDKAILDRVHVEINYPVMPDQLRGLTVFECGVPWLATVGREDAYIGSDAIVIAPPHRRTVAAIFADNDCPAVGSAVSVDGEAVGTVTVSIPRLGNQDGLGLLVMDDPMAVPGIAVEAGGVSGMTVSRPVIAPESWSEGMEAT